MRQPGACCGEEMGCYRRRLERDLLRQAADLASRAARTEAPLSEREVWEFAHAAGAISQSAHLLVISLSFCKERER